MNKNILPLVEQYGIMDKWLKHRLEDVLPQVMKREGIDMWIVLAREYNEDPVFLTLIPALARTASRLSCLVFFIDGNEKLECLSLGRPNELLENFYARGWDGKSETQWECIKRIIAEREPLKIGVNLSQGFALGDGLTKTLYEELLKALGDEYVSRIVSAERLCIGWLETRSLPELEAYAGINAVANSIIEEAFSEKVIKAGETTTEAVEWWIMQKINDLGLEAWFTPTIDLQRKGAEDKRISGATIMHGDVLHCDVGIKYLGLCTDAQKVAYVLSPEESEVPKGLKDALKNCNTFQDIVTGCFAEGKSGNEVLSASLREAREQGINAMLYTHPIGFHGHGAGPLIGLWDNQKLVPVRGDCTLNYNTCYALELNASREVPEWDSQEVTVFLEETVCFTRDGVSYLKERQREFILI